MSQQSVACKAAGSEIATPVADTGELIANLLVEGGHLTAHQLAHAKRIRAKLATPRTLLSVLQELQLVSTETLSQTLRANRTSLRLGDLLVELGLVTRSELEAALDAQREAGGGKALGEFLVDNGYVEEHKLVEVLSFQLGYPCVDPHLAEIDRTLLAQAAPGLYSGHGFIPFARQDGQVLVAFSDPLDRSALQAARKVFGPDLAVAIATKRAISDAVALYERSARRGGAKAHDEHKLVGLVNEIIAAAVHEGASDIHMEPQADRLRVRLRCDGVLVHHRELPRELAAGLASRIKVLAGADIAERRRHQDGRILFEDPEQGIDVDMRASFYVTIHGEKVVLRLLNRKGELLAIEDIGMAPRMLERFRDDALDVPSGVVMVTGPTGSGKTTTLYSAVNHLNDVHTSIVTVEDPVEYVIEGIAQCSINPKIQVTFEETLRHVVRQDPDVIVLGEIRDRFSAETAIQAALTGHKVLTTFHTEDSIGGLLRLLNMDIEAFLISSTVVSVVAQRLLRRVCSHCQEPYAATPFELRRLGYRPEDLAGARLVKGRGCSRCRFTGYRGRVGIFELLVLNEQVKDAILGRKTSYEIRRVSLETSGLVTLLEDGVLKAAKGETTLQEILRQLPRLSKPRPLQELRRILGE